MELITEKGQLDLPQEFGMTMERTNPLLSGEGDATVPMTLPASAHNLAVLGHRERIDRADQYINKEDAVLQAGAVQKRGTLVIDTLHRREGIDTSFAINNGDLYAQGKDMTLKEIFSGWKGGIGMNIPFTDIDSACQYMISIYDGTLTGTDFAVFPVAVSPYETGDDDSKETVYQHNNEPDDEYGLKYKERVVREGDINMLVPAGYGIAPFLKLQRLVRLLFEIMDYTVDYNCFEEDPGYTQIVIVHNCADCLCNPQTTLYYKDLVPSCTLSEFLEWLLAKFHVQPVVNSQTKHVRIVRMDDILNLISGGYDEDLSGLVVDDWKVQLNPSKRVVLTPTTEIEGTEAAAETFDKLVEKYSNWVECNEDQFDSLLGPAPAFSDCLFLRNATGVFYMIDRRLDTGAAELHPLGTNYFAYDRDNSDDTEAFSQADVMPLMLCGPKRETEPYIGGRIHLHTSYKGKADDSGQKIIAVQAHTSSNFTYTTTGTTQKHIPYASGGSAYSFWFGMDNYSLYGHFWRHYNTLLLNRPVHLTGRVKLSPAKFLDMDMSTLKLCDGQTLLPVKASARIGDRIGMTEAEFVIAKFAHYSGDTEIHPTGTNGLRWERNAFSWDNTPFDEDAFCQNLFVTKILANNNNPGGLPQYTGWYVEFEDYAGLSIWLGTPQTLGEQRKFVTTGHYKIKYKHYYYNVEGTYELRDYVAPTEYTLPSDLVDYDHDVIIIFTAVAV